MDGFGLQEVPQNSGIKKFNQTKDQRGMAFA